METIDPLLAVASNIDVLDFLHNQTAVQRGRVQRAISARAKQLAPINTLSVDEDLERKKVVPDDLRSVQYEVTKYLLQEALPHSRQTVKSSQVFVRALLERFPELTKMERFQVVNLVPVDTVSLFTIVQNLEDRIPEEERYEELFQLAKASLSESSRSFADVTDYDQDGSAGKFVVETADSTQPKAEQVDIPEMDKMEWEELEEEEGGLVQEGLSGVKDSDQRDIDEVPDS